MPKNQSKKRDRDNALIARWSGRPDVDFEQMKLSRDRIESAQVKLSGHIVLPGDPTYDHDRMLSNPAFSPSPSMIVFCQTESDVKIALGLALESGVPFTVRSGGHCTAGFSAGFGVLIDVKGLDSFVPDLVNMSVVVGAGLDFGTLDQDLATNGVHLPAGECGGVCVGGFVQGGGLGITSSTYGMNCDNVIEMRVMLADGSIVIANEQQNRDLWWAMRGGTGGNFGILVSVTYRVVVLDRLYACALAWKLDEPDAIAQATDVLMLLQERYFGSTFLDEGLNLQVQIVWQTLVEPGQTQPYPVPVCVFMVRGLWVGDPTDGALAMAPLASMPGAITQWTKQDLPYGEMQDWFQNQPQEQPLIDEKMGMPNEDKGSRYVARDLTVAEWTSILAFFTSKTPNTLSYMYLEVYGGAISTYPMEDSAFIHRTALYNAVLDVFWYRPDDRPASEAFLNDWIHLMETVWNSEVYQNYVSINVPDYVSNYWGSAVPGLVKVKNKYDPHRHFTFAQQVPYELAAGVGDAAAHLPARLSDSLGSPIDYSGGVPADPLA